GSRARRSRSTADGLWPARVSVRRMMARLLSILAWLLGALLALLVLATGTLLWMSRPLGSPDLVSHPHPAAGYDEARARFERIERGEPADVLPVCHSHLFGHRRRTRRAIVL